MKKRIYVAGPLSPKGRRADASHPAIEYLFNVRDMVQFSVALMLKGWSVYCPAIDFQLFLGLPQGAVVDEPMIKAMSLDWLEVSDAIFMMPGWEKSTGSVEELRLAADLGLDEYYRLEDVPTVKRDVE